MNKKLVKTIEYTAKHSSYEILNSQLTKARCYIMASGKNANRSNITLQAMKSCISLLGNTPVVAHLYKKSDGTGTRIGGHDVELKISDSDGITMKDLTVPFGVIPENCNPEIVEVLEEDGMTKNNYLIADVILWTGRYPIMDASYSSDIYFNQSCEIIIDDCHYDKDDYLIIEDFTLSALCLLNKSDDKEENVRPCFPSCRVEKAKYSLDQNSFKKEFALLMQEVRSLAFKDTKPNKEGNHKMKEKIVEILSAFKFTNAVGKEASKYEILDIRDDAVDVIDREGDYKLYSIPYSKNETGELVIEYDNKAEKSIMAGEKSEVGFSIKSELTAVTADMVAFAISTHEAAVISELNEKYAKLEGEYNALKTDSDKDKAVLVEYAKAKTDAEFELHKAEINKKIEEYQTKMGSYSEYLIYRSKVDYSKTVDQTDVDMLILLGKFNKGKPASFSYIPQETSINEEKNSVGNSRYGTLFDKIQK